MLAPIIGTIVMLGLFLETIVRLGANPEKTVMLGLFLENIVMLCPFL